MTVCHTLELPIHTVTVEYDRDADWDSHWVIVLSSPPQQRTEMRRYFSYTEARRETERVVNLLLKNTHQESRTK